MQSLSVLFFHSTAAGLYYLAELVEEYTVLADKCIKWLHIVRLEKFLYNILFVYLFVYLQSNYWFIQVFINLNLNKFIHFRIFIYLFDLIINFLMAPR